jgi:hypothetical protein
MSEMRLERTECQCGKKIHAKGLCKNCYDKQLKTKDLNYRQRQLDNSRKYAIEHADQIREYGKKRRLLHKDRDRITGFKSMIKRTYGLSIDEYNEIVSKSNNTCYICGRKSYSDRRLHLDHDHKTGKVRGILCARCNWYLATIEKNPGILDKIKLYLDL